MTTETRFIAVSAEQAGLLEGLGQELLRRGDPDGIKILALHMAWKYAPTVTQIPMEEHAVRAAERMVEELDSERARFKVLEGGKEIA